MSHVIIKNTQAQGSNVLFLWTIDHTQHAYYVHKYVKYIYYMDI